MGRGPPLTLDNISTETHSIRPFARSKQDAFVLVSSHLRGELSGFANYKTGLRVLRDGLLAEPTRRREILTQLSDAAIFQLGNVRSGLRNRKSLPKQMGKKAKPRQSGSDLKQMAPFGSVTV